MKIQCDVCSKKEASIFCSADEAALCDACDQRVHHANKLASKHERFALLHSSPSHAPLCDICQEKRAVLFCQQDRAIMCRDCELPLHTANEHTQKHNRFLLTGIKLSEIIDDKNDVNGCDPVPDFKSAENPTSEISSCSTVLTQSLGGGSDSNKGICSFNDQLVSGGSTSSISEYLIEMLPGWHFEDFLVDSSSTYPFGLCKSAGVNDFEAHEDLVSFSDVDLFDKKLTTSSIQAENLGIWVPQAPPPPPPPRTIVYGEAQAANNHKTSAGGLVQGTKQQETSVSATKGNRKCRKDDGFAVPQITQSVGYKRIRPFC